MLSPNAALIAVSPACLKDLKGPYSQRWEKMNEIGDHFSSVQFMNLAHIFADFKFMIVSDCGSLSFLSQVFGTL